ncbi:uncharacterized protein TRIADDRAFT_59574 [Trichoplax adhaerens]|uniref:CARD domain-containing protein n=1 Tax=Trichoplax adhaerens TaxID=10228 RepID=B3S613_TRIAD|nr:predicted protein [Trichoplax adhaerens]EDV22012.1 predicted protein [Trichoplax adhaerens]|eukprot:XP_002115649.1 predicted protein [Trichoplax adhaerens]
MGLSDHIQKVIDNNREKLTNDLSVKHLLIDLNTKKVLNYDEMDELEDIKPEKKQNAKFLRFLERKEDRDFDKFCEVLQGNQASALQNLGLKLRNEACGDSTAQGQDSHDGVGAVKNIETPGD